ncbi:hypothetical protein [Streptomyces purpureus]|uniref:Uncharacterized protein n=1 Tax=Streptomyces purpureus TaxID=1951 RepID=A0A918H712_9ACTN|nr:hypothetical protein [Streptomyces purpureus]GGT43388.1 hypothetical protein GCM10014713_41330 [Streptomyces purpureus]
MRIRMTVDMSGTRNGQPWPPRGDIADLPTAEAAHLCASGIAEPVTEPEPVVEVEQTTAPPAETTEVPAAETTAPPAEKRRGRPRLPRDGEGNIVRE